MGIRRIWKIHPSSSATRVHRLEPAAKMSGFPRPASFLVEAKNRGSVGSATRDSGANRRHETEPPPTAPPLKPRAVPIWRPPDCRPSRFPWDRPARSAFCTGSNRRHASSLPIIQRRQPDRQRPARSHAAHPMPSTGVRIDCDRPIRRAKRCRGTGSPPSDASGFHRAPPGTCDANLRRDCSGFAQRETKNERPAAKLQPIARRRC